MRLNKLALILALALTGVAHADLILNPGLNGKTLLIRQRSFAPGAAAGWTNTPFRAGAPGSPLINAQPAAIQSALRLVDVDSNQIYPVEPRLNALGPVESFATALTRLETERAEQARTTADAADQVRALETKLRFAQIDRNVLDARYEAIGQQRRIVMRELLNRPNDPDAKAQLADLDRQEITIGSSMLRTGLSVKSLTDQRDQAARAVKDESVERLKKIDQAADALAGFYAVQSEPGCARPWEYRARPNQAVNPFYPGTGLESDLGDARLNVCVVEGRLHRTQLLDRDNRVILKVLYGRNAQGLIDRIVIRDAAGALIEDHQFLPGPNQSVRYGLTFRNDRNGLTSVYTDLERVN